MTFEPLAFQDFRDDHRRVLDRIDGIEPILGGEARSMDALPEPPIRDLLTLLQAQFATHMRDEEELLFPALAESLPETAAGLERLHAEHVDLRQMLATIIALLEQPCSRSRDEQMVVQLRDFVDLLRIHVHKE